MLVVGAPSIPALAVVSVLQVAALVPQVAAMAILRVTRVRQLRAAPQCSSPVSSHKANLVAAMMPTSSAVTKVCGTRSIQAKIAMAIWKTFSAVASGKPNMEKAAVLPPRPFFLTSLLDD